MHVPIGVSGVQAVPNTLHSHGLSTPLSTSPHWHAFGSATRTPGTLNSSSASQAANSSLTFNARGERKPRPRHSKYGRNSMVWPIALSAVRLLFQGTTREYWFSTFDSPRDS